MTGKASVPITPQRSSWLRSALPGREWPCLQRAARAEFLIIGAGLTGLNAALRLLEQGRSVLVIDAEDVGFGASGRNGGQVIAGLKHDPNEIVEAFGEDLGMRMVRFAGDAPRATFALIKDYGLDCQPEQRGWLQPAVDDATLRTVTARARSWAQACDVQVEILDAKKTRALTGSDFYNGAWLDPRGGQLQPLSYTRELARVVKEKGGEIYTRSRATNLTRQGDEWHAEVNGHTVTAAQVLICTNGYSGNIGTPLARSIVPGSSIMCATRPLPDAVRRSIMPERLPMSDARRLMNYIRLDPQGRFMIGARGSFRLTEPDFYFTWLQKIACRIFPQLQEAEWEDCWGGVFALTPNFYPHVHQPQPGLFAVLGCNGRGVAILTQLGRAVADLAHSGDKQAFPFPITPVRPIPLHAFRRPALEAALLWYKSLDLLGR